MINDIYKVKSYEYVTSICNEDYYMLEIKYYSNKYEGDYAQIDTGERYYSNKPYCKEYLDMLLILGLCEVLR